MIPTLDPVATGHKLCNIASNLRGQAALAREQSCATTNLFSCVLDSLAEQVEEAVGSMFDPRLKLIGVDSDQDDDDDDIDQSATAGAEG